MGSLVVAVRSLVIDAVAALPEFADAEVSFGYKVGSKRREKCWTQNAKFARTPAGMRAGKKLYNETATFDLVILVEGIAKTVEEVAERALELGAAVEDYAAWNVSPSGTVSGLVWVQIEGDGGALVEAFNDNGSIAELTYPFAYHGRIT